MKKIFFIFLLLPFFGLAQFPTNRYTNVSGGFNWERAYFRAFNLPVGCGAAALKAGQWTGSGAVYMDTCANKVYLYALGSWREFGAGTALSSLGSGYKILTSGVKSITATNGLTPDSATSGQLGLKWGGTLTQGTLINAASQALVISSMGDGSRFSSAPGFLSNRTISMVNTDGVDSSFMQVLGIGGARYTKVGVTNSLGAAATTNLGSYLLFTSGAGSSRALNAELYTANNLGHVGDIYEDTLEVSLKSYLLGNHTRWGEIKIMKDSSAWWQNDSLRSSQISLYNGAADQWAKYRLAWRTSDSTAKIILTQGNTEMYGGSSEISLSNSGYEFDGLPALHGAADSMMVFNPSSKFIGYRPIPAGGSTPTWETTITAQGATAFTNDHTVDFGGQNIQLNNASDIFLRSIDADGSSTFLDLLADFDDQGEVTLGMEKVGDSTYIKMYDGSIVMTFDGNLEIRGLGGFHNAIDSMMVINPTTHKVGYRPIPSGGSGATTALDNLASVAINTSLLPGTDNSINLGSTSKQWNNAYIGTGGTINFNNGDVTLTHSSDRLALAGGVLRVPDGSVSAPSLIFTNSSNTGLYSIAAGTMSFSASGTNYWLACANTGTTPSKSLRLDDDMGIGWSTNPDGAADEFLLYRDAANSLRLTTATVTFDNLAGTGSRTVLASSAGLLSAPVSDISTKQNIEYIDNGLQTVMKLKPVSFEYRDEFKKQFGKGKQIGFIAQDIQKVLPNSVYYNTAGIATGKMGYNETDIIPILTKAIQEQQKIIEDLLIRIEKLEHK